jgi:hypothetical protein
MVASMSTHTTIYLPADRRFWVAAILALILAACAAPPPLLTPSLPQPPPAAPLAVVLPPPPPPPPLKTRLPAIQYTIQAGVFSSAERAQAYMERLIKYGLDAYYFMDQDGLYKVRFERFDGTEKARERAETLQARGVIESFFIVKPQPIQPLIDQRAELQSKLVQTALKYIGVPYRWGGTSKQNGFDCSGLAMTVYRLYGMELPRSSASQFLVGDPVAIESLQLGDLVFFSIGKTKRIDHVGIYSGDGKFIHAPGRGKRISESALFDTYFKTRYKGARRYF